MRVHFTENGWADYRYWCDHDREVHGRVNQLIEDARRTPFTGLGKPEPLKGILRGFWSRRITGEHRLVYTVEGKDDAQCIMAQCRYHYRPALESRPPDVPSDHSLLPPARVCGR